MRKSDMQIVRAGRPKLVSSKVEIRRNSVYKWIIELSKFTVKEKKPEQRDCLEPFSLQKNR